MLWESIKESLREFLPASEYGLWIKPLACKHQDEQLLELTGPDRYFCTWVRDHYVHIIKSKLNELGLANFEIKLSVASQPVALIQNNKSSQLQLPGVQTGGSSFRALHPRYTFDHFMVGESNILASSACQAMAEGDNKYGNSLFLNSTTGLGKSHLTQAVAHTVLMQSPGIRLHYLTAQQFSAEMVNRIRNGGMDQFSRKYVNDCDMLLVEDIHTLGGKVKTQDELNIILDYLLKTGKRVIFTSAVEPCNLKGLDEDFKSRMMAGLVTQIKMPDYETRFNIIRHKALINDLVLSEELVDYLARHMEGDIRRTESALLGLKAKSCMLNVDPDMSMIKEMLRDLLGETLEMDGETILNFVSQQYKVSVEVLRSRSRKRSIAFPRQMAMYLTRKYTELSLQDIGRIYNRDHSTVMHSVKVITRDISLKTTVRNQVDLLTTKLKG